jgi:ABC-type branched-subunit amino acid transport system permease subunit
VTPDSIFGVRWTAYMICMVLLGGLGTSEGQVLCVLVDRFGVRLVPVGYTLRGLVTHTADARNPEPVGAAHDHT